MMTKNKVSASRFTKHRFFLLAIIGATLVFSTLFIMHFLSRPIADDFPTLYCIHDIGSFGCVSESVMYLNGRFSSNILVALSVGLFDELAINVLPMVLLGLLVVGLWLIAFQLLARNRDRFLMTTAIAFGASVAIILSLPSIFDSVVWFSAAMVHLASVVFACLLIAYVIWLAKLNRSLGIRDYGLLVVASIFCQGFSEITAILLFIAAAGLVIFCLASRRKANLSLFIVLLVGLAIGLAIVYFMPGTFVRSSTQAIGSREIVDIIVVGLKNFVYLKDVFIMPGLPFVLVLAASLVLGFGDKIKRRLVLLIGTLLTIIPTLVAGLIASYTGVIGDDGYMLHRLAVITMTPTVIGLALILSRLLASIKSLDYHKYHHRLAGFGILSVIIGTMWFWPRNIGIIQAESLRSSLHQYRSALVAEYKSGLLDEPLTLIPAPILLKDSQAMDLMYRTDMQRAWIYTSILNYYSLKETDDIVISQQPLGYCMADFSNLALLGLESCQK
jgi:hypothetical protein